jgi:serine/threonine protein kinase
MAPEAYRDEKCTEKIDIYSLSMMMWEMLTGKLPWDGMLSVHELCTSKASIFVPLKQGEARK